MKTITFSDLNSLHKWMVFIVNTKAAQLAELNYQLNIFGDDNAYLIINKYENKTSATEYYFKPDDKANYLLALISLLEKFNFSLENLINELQIMNFVESEFGDQVIFNDISIFRELVKSN